MSNTEKSNNRRVIYYYQTFTDLTPILNLAPQPVTHIILAAIHFGKDSKTNEPYIHLNNLEPTNNAFDKVWYQLQEAKDKCGIDIRLMIGGAGGAYTELFSDYDTYYPMLTQLLYSTRGLITGVDLDVEEPVALDDIRQLIADLALEFPGLRFTMAPVASALYTPGTTGMGGFSYLDLLKTPEGKLIEWFNGQFYYGDFDVDHFSQAVANLSKIVDPSKIVMGTVTGQWSPDEWSMCYDTLSKVVTKYPNMGGTFFWEYYLRPDNWEKDVANAMAYNTSSDINNKDNNIVCVVS